MRRRRRAGILGQRAGEVEHLALVVTSSPAVGSSAMSSLGWYISAMASTPAGHAAAQLVGEGTQPLRRVGDADHLQELDRPDLGVLRSDLLVRCSALRSMSRRW